MSGKKNGSAGPMVDLKTPAYRRKYIEDRLGAGSVLHWEQKDFDACYLSIVAGVINEVCNGTAGVNLMSSPAYARLSIEFRPGGKGDAGTK